MPSLSLALEAEICSDQPAAQTCLRSSHGMLDLHAAEIDRAKLLEDIRRYEGEPVLDPPFLFKLVVAIGLVITAAGVFGMGLGVVRLTEWLL